MKTVILALTFLTAISSFANTVTYINESGCVVEVESRKKGVIYYVYQGKQSGVVGVTNDLTSGSFAYCDDSALRVSSYEGKKGTGILVSCSEHQNDNAVTRGRVYIDIMGGELASISFDGQVKRFFGWKQDTKIECKNLVRQ